LRADWRRTPQQGSPRSPKRGNSLRVTAEAVSWGKRGARINTISPGIIITPLASDELTGPRGAGYRRMIELSAAGRAGTPDEVAIVAALLMGPDGGFITGSDFLMDGGVTAAYWFATSRRNEPRIIPTRESDQVKQQRDGLLERVPLIPSGHESRAPGARDRHQKRETCLRHSADQTVSRDAGAA
jgi:hypothetical protein